MFLPGLPVWAGTVVGVDTLDPNSIGGYVVAGGNTLSGPQALAIAWTQFAGATVSVGINFQTGLFDTGGTFYAYLTDTIGSQATSSNEVAAPTSFTLPDPSVAGETFGPAWIDLFDQIDLDAGFYYLTIGAGPDSSGAWSNTSDPTVTEAAGFFRGDLLTGSQFSAFGSDVSSYLPASNFSPISTVADGGGPDLMFDVSIPEPGTIWLLGGALSLALLRRKRSL
jgi:hypothetical protein